MRHSRGDALALDADLDLAALADALAASGLGEFVGCFNPLRPRRAYWELCRDQAPASLQPLIDLFLLNRPVALDALPERIRRLVPAMLRSGVADGGADAVHMTQELILTPAFGLWLLCQPPSLNPTFYFGDDSLALLARMTPRAGGQCLDLCAGPGLLALHGAARAAQTTAVERSPRVAALARVNAALNRLSDRVEVIEGDLFEPVRGRRFDTIIANPPMLPYPEGLKGPQIEHGGGDGLRVTRRILAGLPDALSETGVAQMIGTCLSDGDAPISLDQFPALCGERLDLMVSILAHHALTKDSPTLNAIVATVAAISGSSEAAARDAYAAMLDHARASHLCNLFIHAVPGTGRLRRIDLAQGDGNGRWFL